MSTNRTRSSGGSRGAKPRPGSRGINGNSNLEKRKIVGQYMLGKTIGEGTFGQVVKAKNRLNNEVVAIKCINDNFEQPYACRKLLREIKIMRKLSKIENNIFTPKLIDVIIPTEALLEGDSTKSSQSGSFKIDDLEKINKTQFVKTHLFLVKEFVDNDMKKLMNNVT